MKNLAWLAIGSFLLVSSACRTPDGSRSDGFACLEIRFAG
jgi:hypothetical protein